MGQMAETMIDRLRDALRHGHTSFAELSRVEGFRGENEYVYEGPEYSNIVIWAGMSEAAVDALGALFKAGEFHLYPTTALIYLCDGAALNLPTASQMRHYKKPHWLPCVINQGPAPRHASRRQPLQSTCQS